MHALKKKSFIINNLIPNTLDLSFFGKKYNKMDKNADLWVFSFFITSFHVILIILITLVFCITSHVRQLMDIFNHLTFCTASHERQLTVGSKSHCRAVPAVPSPIWCASNLIFIISSKLAYKVKNCNDTMFLC